MSVARSRKSSARGRATDGGELRALVREEVERVVGIGVHAEVASATSQAIAEVLGDQLRMVFTDLVNALGALTAPKTSRRGASALLVSKREAARRLGIDRNKALPALIHSGQLETVSKNGATAIPVTEIERLATQGFDTSLTKRKPRRRRPPPSSPQSQPPTRASTWKLKL